MTHFTVLVIAENEDQVNELLAPYDEQLEVAPYKRFLDENSIKGMKKHFKKDDIKKLVEHMPDWTGEKGGIENDKLFTWTTYNPKSKWDWYAIGGRWTGAFDNYEASEDKANYYKCHICNGTGTRDDGIAMANGLEKFQEFNRQPPKGCPYPVIGKGCNSCQGTGYTFNWLSPKRQDDARKVSQIPKDFRTWAIVTPDGEWHEKGKMGWWGMAVMKDGKVEGPDERSDEEYWNKEVQEIYEKYADSQAILVDCHI